MVQKHSQSTDQTLDSKKKRRINLSPIDSGVEPNDCIEIYLVSSKEEVEGTGCYRIDPVDLNQFFGEEEKIYGYLGLKIVVWISSISFQAYVEITYESTSDRGKGITDLKAALQDIFGETILEKKEDFLATFSTETQYIRSVVSKGETLPHDTSAGKSDVCKNGSHADSQDVEVIRLVMGETSAGHLYSRLVPLVLLLVDGSNAIDVTDSDWEIYVLVQKTTDQQGNDSSRLLGFAAVYRFYHYPDSSRLRLSQILVLPPYQKKGHGCRLLELLNHLSISENVHDLTVEEPVDSLQHIRYCIDVPRLLACSSVRHAVDVAASRLKEANLSKRTEVAHLLPSQKVVDDVRKSLKISRKQFLQCWEILIYLALNPNDKDMENYRIFITDRVKANVIGRGSGTKGKRVIDVPNDFGEDAFVMCKSEEGEEAQIEEEEVVKNREQQIQQLVDERLTEIKSVAQKMPVLYA